MNLTKANILFAVATSEFRSFREADWSAYAGCRSADPRIAELDEFVVIVDGDEVYVEVYETGDHHILTLKDC